MKKDCEREARQHTGTLHYRLTVTIIFIAQNVDKGSMGQTDGTVFNLFERYIRLSEKKPEIFIGFIHSVRTMVN